MTVEILDWVASPDSRTDRPEVFQLPEDGIAALVINVKIQFEGN